MMNEGDTLQRGNAQTLGRYRLVKCAGRGGMGEVWLGEDPRLNRQVAIKTLPTHNQSDREFYLRFEREAQAAAALSHPHILPVYDYGEQALPNGQVITYIVMPFIQGGSLADRIMMYKGSNTMMPPQEALTYLKQAAEAIDYAHEQGVIHRDIKPGNMLLRNEHWILLADFGIARMLSSTENLTQTGVGFGTPEYMAPEQAQGRAVAASDNYSLAIIAYYLLTGRLPFKAETGYATTIQHLMTPPPPPRQFNPGLSPATEMALLQSMAKDPAGRPPTAQAMIAALQQSFTSYQTPQPGAPPYWAGGGPSTPGITPILPQTGQFGPAATGVNPITGQPISYPPFNGPTNIPNNPPPGVPTPGSTPDISRRKLLLGGIGGAALLAAGGGIWWFTRNSAGQGANQPTQVPQNTTPATQKPVADPNAPTLILRQHNEPVSALVWLPQKDGFTLASASPDKRVMLWNIQKLQQEKADKPKQEIDHRFTYGSDMLLAWSPDGKYLAVGNGADESSNDSLNEASISLYKGDLSAPAAGFETQLAVQGDNSVDALTWQNQYLISALISNTLIDKKQFQVNVWDVTRPEKQWEPINLPEILPSQFGGARLPLLASSPDGILLAAVTMYGIQVGQLTVGDTLSWQAATDLLKIEDSPLPPQPNTVTWSSNGNAIATFATPRKLALWDWKNEPKKPFLINASKDVTALAWSPAPGSSLIATGNKDGSVSIWNPAKSNLPIKELNNGDIKAEIVALSWSTDGQWLAAGVKDNYASILVWKVEVRG